MLVSRVCIKRYISTYPIEYFFLFLVESKIEKCLGSEVNFINSFLKFIFFASRMATLLRGISNADDVNVCVMDG